MIYAIGIDPGAATGIAVVTEGKDRPIVLYAATCRERGETAQAEAFSVSLTRTLKLHRLGDVIIFAIQSPCVEGRKMPVWRPKGKAMDEAIRTYVSLIKNAYKSGLYIGMAIEFAGAERVCIYPSQDARGMKMPPAIFEAAFDNQSGARLSEHARDAAILAAKALKERRPK